MKRERPLRNVWFLNLDAEDELARPVGYTPSRAMSARIRGLVGKVPGLTGPDDIVVGDDETGTWQSGGPVSRSKNPGPIPGGPYRGIAWCPTPRAIRGLGKVGVEIAGAPALAVLQAVNHRRFNATLGQTLPGGRYVTTVEEVLSAVEEGCPSGRWLLKRPFGYAGRGRLAVEPRRAGDVERARSWIEASLREGDGLQVEPWVERRGDFGLHGYLMRDGATVFGEPTRLTCDANGAWVSTTRAEAGDIEGPEREALYREAERAAKALHEAGYFGPFGVDAFRWVEGRGACQFNARCEINARYSMGWAIGMGDRRPDLAGAEP
ncbi:MAG: hypothetical protein U0441_26775 [Polyangiaceae bacterium]